MNNNIDFLMKYYDLDLIDDLLNTDLTIGTNIYHIIRTKNMDKFLDNKHFKKSLTNYFNKYIFNINDYEIIVEDNKIVVNQFNGVNNKFTMTLAVQETIDDENNLIYMFESFINDNYFNELQIKDEEGKEITYARLSHNNVKDDNSLLKISSNYNILVTNECLLNLYNSTINCDNKYKIEDLANDIVNNKFEYKFNDFEFDMVNRRKDYSLLGIKIDINKGINRLSTSYDDNIYSLQAYIYHRDIKLKNYDFEVEFIDENDIEKFNEANLMLCEINKECLAKRNNYKNNECSLKAFLKYKDKYKNISKELNKKIKKSNNKN